MNDYLAPARTVKERKCQGNQSGYSSECTRDLARVVFHQHIPCKARITTLRSKQNLGFDIMLALNSLLTHKESQRNFRFWS